MELIHYLNDNFYTKAQLLSLSKVSSEQFKAFQVAGMMPRASYRLQLTLQCDSFFGHHDANEASEYYAKGYLSWLTILLSLPDAKAAQNVFRQRYCEQIERLAARGFLSESPKLNADFEATLDEEWQHFLAGTYGLCTKTGLPEDIASKKLAILMINEHIEHEQLDDQKRATLARTVSLLDRASSMFAPHERSRSSRQRLINDIRLQYQLKYEHE